MKKVFYILLSISLMLSSCIAIVIGTEDDDDISRPQYRSEFKAIKYTRAELDQSIQLQDAQEIVNSGKIYVHGHLLFVAEQRKGFHVFDNSDPSHPNKIKFIQVLGSSDLAIRNDVLYINQATDLIALQYNAIEDHIQLMSRVENTFPQLRSPFGDIEGFRKDSVTVDWQHIH